jgi:hypothetical protein
MMSTTSSTYGRQLEPSDWNRERSLIQSPSLSGSGNVILRVGREWESGGSWHQTEHVVLSPDEAASLTTELGVLQDQRYIETTTLGTLVLRYLPDGVDIDRLARALEHSRLPEVIGEYLDEDQEEAAEDRFDRMDAVEVNAEAGRIIGEDKVSADELRDLLRTYGDDEAPS